MDCQRMVAQAIGANKDVTLSGTHTQLTNVRMDQTHLSRLIAGERVEVDSVLAVRMASHETIGIGHTVALKSTWLFFGVLRPNAVESLVGLQ